MVRLLSYACVLVAMFVLPAFAQAPAPISEEQFKSSGNKPLDGKRLAEMLTGNTGYFLGVQGDRVTGQISNAPGQAGVVATVYWKSAKSAVILVTNADTGKRSTVDTSWWIDGDRYCFKGYFSAPTYGIGAYKGATDSVRCSRFYDLGGVTYTCRDGQCAGLLRVVPGNPEKL
jgi:hypothetical protein